MLEADLEVAAKIDAAATDHPWSYAQFAGSLLAGDDCTVLEVDGAVCGFAIFSRVLDEASLLNIAVAPDAQGSGCGRCLLEYGLDAQVKHGAALCFLEVRASNYKAQALYQSLQFTVVGERKNYYPTKSGSEDALVMRWELSVEQWPIFIKAD